MYELPASICMAVKLIKFRLRLLFPYLYNIYKQITPLNKQKKNKYLWEKHNKIC